MMITESVAQYARDRAGTSLRAVVEYDSEEYDLVFVRETLDRADVERRTDVLNQSLVTIDRTGPSEVSATLGEPYASVQIRDAAVIVNLITDDQRGVLISMETDVCRDLHGFVTECLARVDSEDPAMQLEQQQ